MREREAKRARAARGWSVRLGALCGAAAVAVLGLYAVAAPPAARGSVFPASATGSGLDATSGGSALMDSAAPTDTAPAGSGPIGGTGSATTPPATPPTSSAAAPPTTAAAAATSSAASHQGGGGSTGSTAHATASHAASTGPSAKADATASAPGSNAGDATASVAAAAAPSASVHAPTSSANPTADEREPSRARDVLLVLGISLVGALLMVVVAIWRAYRAARRGRRNRPQLPAEPAGAAASDDGSALVTAADIMPAFEGFRQPLPKRIATVPEPFLSEPPPLAPEAAPEDGSGPVRESEPESDPEPESVPEPEPGWVREPEPAPPLPPRPAFAPRAIDDTGPINLDAFFTRPAPSAPRRADQEAASADD